MKSFYESFTSSPDRRPGFVEYFRDVLGFK